MQDEPDQIWGDDVDDQSFVRFSHFWLAPIGKFDQIPFNDTLPGPKFAIIYNMVSVQFRLKLQPKGGVRGENEERNSMGIFLEYTDGIIPRIPIGYRIMVRKRDGSCLIVGRIDQAYIERDPAGHGWWCDELPVSCQLLKTRGLLTDRNRYLELCIEIIIPINQVFDPFLVLPLTEIPSSSGDAGSFLFESMEGGGHEVASANFTLISTDDVPFHVHTDILYESSPFFRTLFSTRGSRSFRENQENEMRVPEMSADVLREMLRYIYTRHLPRNLNNQLVAFLNAAGIYELDGLKRACEREMIVQMNSLDLPIDQLISYLLLSDEHQLEAAKNCARCACLDRWDELTESDQYQTIKQNSVSQDPLTHHVTISTTVIDEVSMLAVLISRTDQQFEWPLDPI